MEEEDFVVSSEVEAQEVDGIVVFRADVGRVPEGEGERNPLGGDDREMGRGELR